MRNKEISKYLQEAHAVKENATKFLKKSKLLKILEKMLTEYTFVGSFTNDTMVYNDIDISFPLKKHELDYFFELGNNIVSNIKHVTKMIFKNEYIAHTELPDGYYWGIEIHSQNNKKEKWKIDLKGLPINRYKKEKSFIKQLEKNLTDEQRAVIICAKKKLLYYDKKQSIYRTPKSSSYYIYDMVINKKLMDPNKIAKTLKTNLL